MIIVGIDPGYAIVGYGVISYEAGRFKTLDCGAVTTEAGMDFASRIERIYDAVTELLLKYKPGDIAVEQLYFTTNQKTAIAVAQARGVILLSARKNNICISEYTPLQIKQSVTGYGKATKKQVIEMTRMLLKLDNAPRLDDTADALAVAICHAHSSSSRLRMLACEARGNKSARERTLR